MNETPPAPDTPIEIRKYPNRRYYDTSRSRHLTLEEIRGLIRDGRTVRIVDSETSADITGRVLTQIILELDTPKLEFFPVPLLQQVIRVNDQMVKGYLERFLRQSSEGFSAFLKQFEDPLRGGAMFPPAFAAFATPWVKPAGEPAPAAAVPPPPASGVAPATGDAPAAESALAGSVEALRREVAGLRQRLSRARRAGAAGGSAKGGGGRARPRPVASAGKRPGARPKRPAAARRKRVVRTQK